MGPTVSPVVYVNPYQLATTPLLELDCNLREERMLSSHYHVLGAPRPLSCVHAVKGTDNDAHQDILRPSLGTTFHFARLPMCGSYPHLRAAAPLP